MISCIQNIFKESDYNTNKIKKSNFKKHNKRENAWVKINEKVYSIRQDDDYLLSLFKENYGKDVTELINNFSLKEKIIILNLLNNRVIGKIEK